MGELLAHPKSSRPNIDNAVAAFNLLCACAMPGASVYLQVALTYLARSYLVTSELAAAARLIEEDSLIAGATGNCHSARPRLST